MRKSLLALVLLLVTLSGCEDGRDGDAFLSFYWVSTPISYSDNNPYLPGTLVLLEPYPVEEGTYSFAYTAWDGSNWAGSYTITIEEGEEGLFPLIPGPDGEDSYFELWLFSIGPSFWDVTDSREIEAIQNSGIDPVKLTQIDRLEYVETRAADPADVMVSEQVKGRYRFTVRASKLNGSK